MKADIRFFGAIALFLGGGALLQYRSGTAGDFQRGHSDLTNQPAARTHPRFSSRVALQSPSARPREAVGFNPQRSAARIETLPGVIQRSEATLELARRWSCRDTGAALVWARQLPEDVRRKEALYLVVAEVGRKNLEAGLALVSEYDLGRPGYRLAGDLVAQWAERDAAAAWDWASKHANETGRADLLGRIAIVVAQSDPEAAAMLIAEGQFPDLEVRNQAAIAVIHKWTQRDPDDTAKWVRELPPGALLEEGVQALVETWAESDAPAAERWLASLPEGKMKASGEQAMQVVRVGTR
ncbi:hypothetical protein OKA05_17305 [Luteolibacter arcticus]|uniref:HEAT repeat domain-containing protein n=1 Tax=Luteolibacter arcticus TaxID=1581411 RepID=A0ABT3GLF4_9BACT|nr:hypothetical protein [Luteolibacter arcticus]MCW1924327.1 hypothetical protein [Luteolibacter arcticus]